MCRSLPTPSSSMKSATKALTSSFRCTSRMKKEPFPWRFSLRKSVAKRPLRTGRKVRRPQLSLTRIASSSSVVLVNGQLRLELLAPHLANNLENPHRDEETEMSPIRSRAHIPPMMEAALPLHHQTRLNSTSKHRVSIRACPLLSARQRTQPHLPKSNRCLRSHHPPHCRATVLDTIVLHRQTESDQ